MYTIGIDEVGRGPIAGPLVVCACAVKKGTSVLELFPRNELKDSKKLTEKMRTTIVERLASYIESHSVVFGLGEVKADRIDDIGLSASIQEAMLQALHEVHRQGVPMDSYVFLDGSLHAPTSYQQETIIKGDEKVPEIALASIIAKVHRDSFMKEVSGTCPEYGFESHVGYGTKAHYAAIEKYGLTPFHRRSFLKNL